MCVSKCKRRVCSKIAPPRDMTANYAEDYWGFVALEECKRGVTHQSVNAVRLRDEEEGMGTCVEIGISHDGD